MLQSFEGGDLIITLTMSQEYAQAKSCANHELVCSKKTAQPSATASATKDVSPIPESGKNVQTSKRFGGKGQPGKTSSRTDSFNCLFCKYVNRLISFITRSN
jgi:hypothetical protein